MDILNMQKRIQLMSANNDESKIQQILEDNIEQNIEAQLKVIDDKKDTQTYKNKLKEV